MKSLVENINQAVSDFDNIKTAIEEKGVEVATGTPTKDYGDKIREISGTADTGIFMEGVRYDGSEQYSIDIVTFKEFVIPLQSDWGFKKKTQYVFIYNIILDNVAFIPDYFLASPISTYLYSIKFSDNLQIIGGKAFQNCMSLELPDIPATVEEVWENSLATQNSSDTDIVFLGTPTYIDSEALSDNFLDIYVPWAEGEVKNAPWGATDATIHYNYHKE